MSVSDHVLIKHSTVELPCLSSMCHNNIWVVCFGEASWLHNMENKNTNEWNQVPCGLAPGSPLLTRGCREGERGGPSPLPSPPPEETWCHLRRSLSPDIKTMCHRLLSPCSSDRPGESLLIFTTWDSVTWSLPPASKSSMTSCRIGATLRGESSSGGGAGRSGRQVQPRRHLG